ncbi:uncharacterized protein [Coffea arabica]|uniref:Reverse transcriptase domain-containing protein n=1 Tax=Coffea arabica TaxID=13443 RepID=A0ABM4VM24_COFAR
MEQINLGCAPSKMARSRDKRNSNLYCLYHRDIGHETEDCNDLKREIERLIKATKRPLPDGSLGHGLGYGPNIVGVINTIAGGPTGGDSQNSRKRTYRQANTEQAEPSSRLSKVISYGPSDPIPAASSSHEALVIEILINNYIVKKVYVDPRSSVDVMYLRPFESLNLTREQLSAVRMPLVGFGGHVVHSEGVVTLTVTVGRHPRCRTIPVNFVMVKIDSPYNLLMGRPTVNALRVVYSTYHLSFKFPTPQESSRLAAMYVQRESVTSLLCKPLLRRAQVRKEDKYPFNRLYRSSANQEAPEARDWR